MLKNVIILSLGKKKEVSYSTFQSLFASCVSCINSLDQSKLRFFCISQTAVCRYQYGTSLVHKAQTTGLFIIVFNITLQVWLELLIQ